MPGILPQMARSRSLLSRVKAPRRTGENHPPTPFLNREGNLAYALHTITDEERKIIASAAWARSRKAG
jgi:hypothetical protein